MLQNNTIIRLFDECPPICFNLDGLESFFESIEAATSPAKHSTALNALIAAIMSNLGAIEKEESKGTIASRTKQCFGWALFAVESLAPGFDAQLELTILLAVRLLQRRAGISRLPVELALPSARDLQFEYMRVRGGSVPSVGSGGSVSDSNDSRAIKLAYELPPPVEFKPDDVTFPYHLWRKDMKLQLAAMRLSGLTALHYVLRSVCDSVRRELWGIIQSPECFSASAPIVLEKVFSTLDTRFGQSWSVPDALRRWQSFSHEKSQSVSAFLATFDKEKSFYESATNRTLEEVDLVARLLDAADPTLALKLQESHGSRFRSLSLEEIKSDLIFFEGLAKKAACVGPSPSTSANSSDSNRHSSGRKQSEKVSSKKDGSKQKNSEQSTDSSAKKVIPRGRCYRCFNAGHNANKCEAGAIAEYSSRCHNCGNYHSTDACSLNVDDLICGYCAAKGHRSSVCTAPRTGKDQPQNVHVVDASTKPPISTSVAFSPCTVDFFLAGKKLSCLVDTGADVSLIDSALVSELTDVRRFPVGTVMLSGIATSGIEASEEVLIPVSDSSGQSIVLPFLSVTRARPSVLLGRNSIAMLQAVGMVALTSLLASNGDGAQDIIKLCSDRYQEAECPSIVCPSSALDDGCQPVSTNFVQSTEQGETSDSVASLLLWHKNDAALVGDFSDPPVPRESDFVALPPPEQSPGSIAGVSVPPVTFPVDGNYRVHHSNVSAEVLVKTVDQLINDLGEKSIPVQNAPEYELFISRCNAGDALDTVDQCFKFEIDWPMEPSFKASWDSTRMVNSLAAPEKALLKKETEMYLSNGWWTLDNGPRPKGMAEGTIFPIRQLLKSTPIRPVLDFRIPNRGSPRASSHANSTFDCHRSLLSALRPGYEVRQLDLRKAFLKLHIRHEVRVRLGSSAFRTRRLCFGLACGPSSLEMSINIVLSLVDCGGVTIIRLLDDLLLVGSPAEVASVEAALCTAFSLFGFDAPLEKRSTWQSTNENSSGSRWLGYLWWWDGSILEVERPLIEFDPTSVTSKRQCFQYAGWFRDGLRYWNDTLARGHADKVRSYSGKADSWDQLLDPKTLKLCRLHLHKALRYWNIDRRFKVPLPFASKDLYVFCDASGGGYGMVFSLTSSITSPSDIWYAECKSFPKNAWHANRRETFCLARTCQKVLMFVEAGFLPSLVNVRISTDSVVAKSAGLPKVKSNRGIDYIVLRRLHETVRETTELLRSLSFTVTIEHIPGRLNSFADRLSRLHEDITLTVAQIGVSTVSASEPLDIDDVKDIQQADPLITSVIDKLTNDAASMTVAEKGLSYGCYVDDGILRRGCDRGPTGDFYSQFVLSGDHPRVRQLVEDSHRHLQHAGSLVIHNQLRRFVWFPKMRRLVSSWVRSCPACQLSSGGGGYQNPTKRYDQPPGPWRTIGLDLFGPLPCSTSGARFILSSTCLLTRYTELVSLGSARAEEVARGIFLICTRWGYPADVRVACRTAIHDNGSQLLTDVVQAALQAWGFKGRTIMSRSPWVGGFYEVRHRLITAALRSLSAESSASQWHLDVPLIQLRLNLQADEETGFTPHALVFGYDASFPMDLALLTSQSELCDRLGKGELSVDTIKEILHSFSERRRKVHDLWAEVWERNRTAYAKKLDRPSPPSNYDFAEGDMVLVRNPRRTKLDSLWRGPYVVRRVLGSATYDVDTGDSKIPYTQHQRNLKPWLGEDGGPATTVQSPTASIRDTDGNEISPEAFYGLPNKLFGHPIGLKELQVYRLFGFNSIEPVVDANGDPFTVFIEQPLIPLGMLRTRLEFKKLKEWLNSTDA